MILSKVEIDSHFVPALFFIMKEYPLLLLSWYGADNFTLKYVSEKNHYPFIIFESPLKGTFFRTSPFYFILIL